MGTDSQGYLAPQRGKAFSFPADHGAHPGFRIEWWYVTSNLTGEDGRQYGIQWTLFRSAIRPPGEAGGPSPWNNDQLWMGHAALTTPDRHFSTERLARGAIGQAGVNAAPFEAWIDDWQLVAPKTPEAVATTDADALDRLDMRARGADFSYDLALRATGPLVRHGDGGYSVKSPQGQASYYYSQPFYQVAGTLNLPQGPVRVTGTAWLDREWSSQPLSANQKGWDWFSLSFADGARLMGFQVRQTDGAPYTSATWISAEGEATALGDGALQLIPLEQTRVEQRELPTRWRVQLPARNLDVVVEALNPQAWMATSIPYWEGPVGVTGTHQGRGYLEMTGY